MFSSFPVCNTIFKKLPFLLALLCFLCYVQLALICILRIACHCSAPQNDRLSLISFFVAYRSSSSHRSLPLLPTLFPVVIPDDQLIVMLAQFPFQASAYYLSCRGDSNLGLLSHSHLHLTTLLPSLLNATSFSFPHFSLIFPTHILRTSLSYLCILSFHVARSI